jgi:hypothetical protein
MKGRVTLAMIGSERPGMECCRAPRYIHDGPRIMALCYHPTFINSPFPGLPPPLPHTLLPLHLLPPFPSPSTAFIVIPSVRLVHHVALNTYLLNGFAPASGLLRITRDQPSKTGTYGHGLRPPVASIARLTHCCEDTITFGRVAA